MNIDVTSAPGLLYAALVNPAGQIMDSWGRMDGDPTIAAILIQAALSAAIDLGQRSAFDECREMALTFAKGGMLATSTADGHLLLFQHAPDADLAPLREKARELLEDLDEPAESETPLPSIRSSLMDALNPAQP